MTEIAVLLRSKSMSNNQLSRTVVRAYNYRREYWFEVDEMVDREKKKHITMTLPLVALCVPLFANYSATITNGCPYETYLRVDGKCLDISAEGLSNITEELDGDSMVEVNQEIEEVSQELEDLSEELDKLCIEEAPETTAEIEMIEDVCQY